MRVFGFNQSGEVNHGHSAHLHTHARSHIFYNIFSSNDSSKLWISLVGCALLRGNCIRVKSCSLYGISLAQSAQAQELFPIHWFLLYASRIVIKRFFFFFLINHHPLAATAAFLRLQLPPLPPFLQSSSAMARCVSKISVYTCMARAWANVTWPSNSIGFIHLKIESLEQPFINHSDEYEAVWDSLEFEWNRAARLDATSSMIICIQYSESISFELNWLPIHSTTWLTDFVRALCVFFVRSFARLFNIFILLFAAFFSLLFFELVVQWVCAHTTIQCSWRWCWWCWGRFVSPFNAIHSKLMYLCHRKLACGRSVGIEASECI